VDKPKISPIKIMEEEELKFAIIGKIPLKILLRIWGKDQRLNIVLRELTIMETILPIIANGLLEKNKPTIQGKIFL